MSQPIDEKLLLARLSDLELKAERGAYPCFSRFLDPGEVQLFLQKMRPRLPYMLWGGYAEAERKMIGFFPDYMEPAPELFPLCALRLSAAEELGHRTVLGSVMSLGLERSLLGDIAKEENGFVIFCCDSIGEYIALNLTRAGRCRVTPKLTDPDTLKLLPKAWKPVSSTVASLRVDCVLGLLTGASRKTAEEMLQHELVQVNYAVCTKGSVLLAEGDVLSIRRFGRAELLEIGGETKKGRMRIVLKKYI